MKLFIIAIICPYCLIAPCSLPAVLPLALPPSIYITLVNLPLTDRARMQSIKRRVRVLDCDQPESDTAETAYHHHLIFSFPASCHQKPLSTHHHPVLK